ncbi:sugar-binding transcriptional regulator [Stappia sp. MMSF_3263]|uniref:sugar-binding transcriptional regulator n=1 Tax=Stappia sp. MMSF_3263 TaxID=3046693 RepID=UPI00273D11BE|nr:sugar-binding transcriptional regulator [Stappia sp. MMSF_3263]
MQQGDWTTDMAIRAAWMSFVGGATQGEIATRLGISTAKVHRLIAHAQKTGLVRFQIAGRPSDCLEIEATLAGEYGLASCLIAPDIGGQDPDIEIRAIAEVAGPHLANLLANPAVSQLGVGMGRTLKAAIDLMPRIQRPDLGIVSISGSLTRKLSANPFDVVQQLAERTGGEGYYLPVPYLAEDAAERDMFLGQRSVQALLERARASDLFVIGIGSVEDDGHLIRRDLISREEQRDLIATGAVCDLMGRFIGRDGRLVAAKLGEKAVGLPFEAVRGARVVALAGGSGKLEATRAALRAGLITDLIVDESLGRALASAEGTRQARSA